MGLDPNLTDEENEVLGSENWTMWSSSHSWYLVEQDLRPCSLLIFRFVLNLYFFFNGSIADLQSYISFRDHAFQYLGKCNEWMSKWMTNELNYSRPYLFLRGWEGKEYASNAGNQVRSLGPEDLLKKVMATHSSFLAWRIPWREEPGELQSMGLQRVRDDWATNTFTSVIY